VIVEKEDTTMSKNKQNRAVSRIMKAAIAKCDSLGLEFRSITLLEADGDGSYILAEIKTEIIYNPELHISNNNMTLTLGVAYIQHKPIAGKTWSVRWN
jgi:hypothetical protein